ncbi:hypothetical protein [Paraclostridium sordellii]|uniref:hypothetical protein n=1 Tax=Paraclostridium sordellii TaxID=1505 RepID=UPI0005E2DCFE|nr:hypothetical protein [Paeniclostridium sordellii]CEN21280.1 Uncharacterised protein [[Clostridium] sordellii] [Paeniclostridium sordellii]
MANQQEMENILEKLKKLNSTNSLIALASINTLYITQLSEEEVKDHIKDIKIN